MVRYCEGCDTVPHPHMLQHMNLVADVGLHVNSCALYM
jgi:hypothetical protein